uniref:Uncharacterized protein n=1 Tax=Lactuca sativa TaxID=4236 RepID=A0A9R1W249_LACSA|nr:hypothetical protein LSAT_V11C300131390 [Lactuca sativa]
MDCFNRLNFDIPFRTPLQLRMSSDISFICKFQICLKLNAFICDYTLKNYDRTYAMIVTTTCRPELGSVHMPTGVECHPLLCHYLMCKEATIFDPVDLEEILFPVGDYRVCFDRKAFYLVTGLRFGDYFHPSSDFAAFREHMFPFVPFSRSMSMDDLTNVFNNSLHHQLSNEDVVRVSMMYPWGILIWYFTYTQLRIVFDKIKDHLNPNSARISSGHTYTLQRFVYAFKVCTLVTSPSGTYHNIVHFGPLGTRTSQGVTHPGTTPARARLTAEFLWDLLPSRL